MLEIRAEAQSALDRQVSLRMIELFGRPLGSADELLDRASDLASEAAGGTPTDRAAWLTTVGRALGRAGRRQDARQALQSALSVLMKERGERHPDTAAVLQEIAELQVRDADFEAARGTYLQALAILEEGWGSGDPTVAACRVRLSEIDARLGRVESSERHARRALRALRSRGAAQVETARAERALGGILFLGGRHGEAEQHLARALDLQVTALGEHAPEVSETLYWSGRLNHALGRLDVAQDALENARRISESRHASELTAALPNLALVRYSQGDFGDARQLYTQALDLHLGRRHDAQLADVLHGLGAIARRRGDMGRASALLTDALRIRQRTLSPQHPEIAANLHQLGLVESGLGDPADAELLLEQALAAREKVLGPRHPAVGVSLQALADLFSTLARFREAADLYERAWAIREEAALTWPTDS